ncbi:hypothetical protein ACFWYW_56605 [Nonomuraea sp. NPDC059023]|uniref:hypothetical protein n=1 Tax=unclassified Nonomuraea TaxID=2593643 RepID=UPI003692FF69
MASKGKAELFATTHIRDELLARAMHLRKTDTLKATSATSPRPHNEALFTDI